MDLPYLLTLPVPALGGVITLLHRRSYVAALINTPTRAVSQSVPDACKLHELELDCHEYEIMSVGAIERSHKDTISATAYTAAPESMLTLCVLHCAVDLI